MVRKLLCYQNCLQVLQKLKEHRNNSSLEHTMSKKLECIMDNLMELLLSSRHLLSKGRSLG